MHAVGVTLVAAFAGSATLFVFYSAVRTEWPGHYFSIEADYGVVASRSFGRYFLFTFAPTYIVSLLSATTCDRFRGSGLTCALLIATAHAVKNNGRHAVRLLRGDRDQTDYALLLVDVSNIAVAFGASLLGALGPGPFPDIVPTPGDFFSTLWTTAFVAIVAVCLLRGIQQQPSVDRLLERSEHEASHLTPVALEFSSRTDTEPALALAILYTENLQRPSWIRAFERVKGRLWPRGTYGVMQVSSPQPISDTESIRLALTGRLANVWIPLGKDGYPDDGELKRVLREWNDNDKFVDLARPFYWSLSYKYPGERPPAESTISSDPPPEPAEERPSEAEIRSQAAVALRKLARLIGDDHDFERLARTADLAPLRGLLRSLTEIAFLPSEQDERLASRLRSDDGSADHPN